MRNKYNVFIKKIVSILTALALIFGMCGIMVISVSAVGTPTALSATTVTYNSLNANWDTVAGTTHYYLDVATDSSFTNMLTGYNAKDMGTATSCTLTGLSSVTNYFYRVKADSGSYSNIVYVQTPAKNGAYSAASTATSGNEYSVSTAAQLKLLADTVNAGTATYNGVTFKLAGNIDLTDFSTGYDSGAGWKPIGVSDSWSFRGQFDGNGYVVKNLYINRPGTGSIGLFGFMNGATAVIKNVGIVDCNIIGDSRVGAIVGWAYGSGNAVISECFSTGSVSGKRYVGGIVGEAETDSFTVRNCYSTADITGTRTNYNTDEGDAGFGGIVGYIYAPGAKTTTVANCYSTGDIAGPNCAGGIVGGIEIRNTSGITITVKNCIALCGTIKTTYSVSTTEETDGVYTGTLNGLRAVSLQNRVIGGLWENTVSGTCSYTFTHTNLYSLDTSKMYYYSTTVATTTSDGTSVTSSDLASNAHNWTNSVINDAGGTIPAGGVTYFDSVTAGNPDSVWYYYQNKQVLPVLTRYADNYPQVLIVPAALDETVPFATDVYANSTNVALFVGNTLIGAYTYNQNGAGTESGSTYQWYRYDTEKGGTGILVGTGTTYYLVSADFGKYLSFEVTPSNGTKSGSAVASDRVGPVQAPTYAATVNVKIDDIAANVTGIVALKNGSTTLIANAGSTGEYTASAANGTYDIYINGADSGTDITIADAAASVTVNYYTATVNTRVDGSASDITGSVELKQGGTTISIAVDSGTGVYTASAANGTYDVYINGVDTGTDIAINNGIASTTVNYYTVSFAAADTGAASGSSISATAGGSSITSGTAVLSGKQVVITAAGAGASTYTYAWSGTGTSGQTAASLTISSLSGTVNAVCTVMGTTTIDLSDATWQSATTYTCGLDLSSSSRMVTISVDSGYFNVPSLGSVLTYLGGTNGTSYISTYGASTQYDSAVFSYSDVAAAEALLSAVIYTPEAADPVQTITATSSTVAPTGSDLYFEGHFYRYVSGSISWIDAVLAAGGTTDTYFGGRGYIATATNQAENSILLKLTDTGGGGSDHWYDAWMGGLWQRNTGTVASPSITRGTDGSEISYSNLSGATSSQRQSLLLDYTMTFSDFNSSDSSTYINALTDTVKYYWIDGPEAGQEIANNETDFSPWHSGEPNCGDFIYIGWEGAYWDDLGAYDGEITSGGYDTLDGYIVEFSGFDGGSAVGKVASDTKTVSATYSVSLNTNGGTVNSGSITSYTYGVGASLPTDVTKSGSVFGGWYASSDLSGSQVTSISSTGTGAKEYWAKWTAATYSITYNLDGGTNPGGAPAGYTYGTGATLPTDVTKSGFVFGGWYTSSDLSGSAVTTIGATDTGAKEYWAKWTAVASSDGDSPSRTITVTETSSDLFAGSSGTVLAEANVNNAFSSSVEVKVTDTEQEGASFGFGAGTEVYPFDISLYIKGTNTKTEPASGYAVTISLPIPEDLLDVKDQLSIVHKPDDWTVATLVSSLKQINGIWYLVFDAKEFSPYALVVSNQASYNTAAGLPYYLDDSGSKVFIGFAADGKYLAPDGVTVLFTPNPKSFMDISTHWGKTYIDFVTEREIFVGTGTNVFSPNTGMTRAMFATVIGRLYERSYGEISISDTRAFTDCNYDDYYGKYVDWAAENGIIQGVGGGLFQPDRQVTRQEMATMLYRFAEFMKLSTSISTDATLNYSDASSIASWAENAALYCQETGIITGRTGGSFAPTETATRAEVAAIIQRFVELVLN